MSGRKAPTVFGMCATQLPMQIAWADLSINSAPAVGNIPYDATEEQLKEKFSEAGPVIAFRFVAFRSRVGLPPSKFR
jgi:hypothetical protein